MEKTRVRFNTGDIFSKSYKYAGLKRYFLVVDGEQVDSNNTSVYCYDVIDLDYGDNTTFVVDHSIKDKLYPIKKEA